MISPWQLIKAGVFSLVLGSAAHSAERRSVLAPKPDWSELEPYQKTITREDFTRLLNTVYAPDGAWVKAIEVGPKAAVVRSPDGGRPEFRLEFAPNAASARPVPRYWTPAGARRAPAGKPLEGLTIALDPGHIGGQWAQMEERWFKIGDSRPVMEGDMALITARYLSARLSALGAKVVMVRDKTEPVTRARPRDFRKAALAEFKRQGITKPRDGYNGPNDPLKFNSIQWQSELLFYRVSEIRTRAELVNRKIKPDVAICLHFNAEEWGDPATPSLTDRDHLHMLVNGNYGAGELRNEDIRFDMLFKLLDRSARDEFPLSDSVAASLATATGLPPYIYHGRGRRVTESPYVWSRNLLANRLYRCPVVYCEPHVMNSKTFFARFQQGDYEGTRMIDGVARKSIYREYADAVTEGVVRHFQTRQAKR